VRKWFILAALVVVLGGGALGLRAYLHGRAETAERGTVVELVIGQTHEVRLASNATTGFTWMAHYDETLLALVEDRYEAPPAGGDPPLLGAGGEQVFVFKALSRGTARVIFEYMRPWESLPPEKSLEYTFNVK
jgi:inhibitor of cysteine peptidase